MIITFQDAATLTGATPSEPIVFDYARVYESMWECQDTNGDPIDIAVLGMPKWTLTIAANADGSSPLFTTASITPTSNLFNMVIGVFDPRIYGWLAGALDKAAFVIVSGYADFDVHTAPAYRFTMPCDMQCTSTFTCPGDLQRALLRELQAAVQRASDSAAYASAAASDVIDTGIVEIRAQADRASGYAASAARSSLDASNAADTASDEAVEAARQADLAEGAKDDAVAAKNAAIAAQGLAEDARDQAVSAKNAAANAQSQAEAARDRAETAAAKIPEPTVQDAGKVPAVNQQGTAYELKDISQLTGITVIPAATTVYTLAEGVQQHTPDTAPTYTLPNVTDATRTHEIILNVRFSATALSADFVDSAGNAITPMSTPTIVAGTEISYLCEWSALQSKWIIMPVDMGGEA